MPATINSDDGVVSGSAGLKTTGGNDGILSLQNNGTTNVTVTAAGNVGIGTASPAAPLDVVTNSSASGIAVRGRSDNISNIAFQSNSGGTNYGQIQGRSTDLRIQGVSLPITFFGASSEVGRFDTSTGNFQFNSGYGSVATAYGCRSWVNFNGTGTVAIRASGNVSSITDNGTGNYTVNFTTAFVDTSYSGVFGCNDNGNTSTMCYRTGGTKSTTAFQVSTASGVAVLADNDMCMVAVFR